MSALGYRCRRVRLGLDLTPPKFGTLIGTTAMTVRRIERGAHLPSQHLLDRIQVESVRMGDTITDAELGQLLLEARRSAG